MVKVKMILLQLKGDIMGRKKVLFLTSRLPEPANDGRSSTLKQYIDMLSDFCDVGIVSLECNKSVNDQSKFLQFVETIEYPSFFKKVMNVIGLSLIKRYPLQVAGVYSKKSQKKFNRIVSEFKPDIVICDMIRTSLYLRKLKFDCKKILDMDDVLSNRYRTSVEAKEDPLGQFKDMLPSVFVKMIKVFHLNKWLLKFETKRMRKAELNAKKYFDKIVLVSQIEAEKLNFDAKTNKVITWPICFEKIEKNTSRDYNPNQICFIGNMNAAQNQTTLRYIANNVMPLLDSKYKLLVIGNCSDEFADSFKNDERIEFTKYVEDMIPYVKNSLCQIAPIRYGSGIKIKVLDAMKIGVPVITSNVGIEGISVTHNKDLFVANSDDDYAKYVDLLFNNPKLRNDIIENAYNTVVENHSYIKGLEIIKKCINGGD